MVYEYGMSADEQMEDNRQMLEKRRRETIENLNSPNASPTLKFKNEREHTNGVWKIRCGECGVFKEEKEFRKNKQVFCIPCILEKEKKIDDLRNEHNEATRKFQDNLRKQHPNGFL